MKKATNVTEELTRRLRTRRRLALAVYGGFALFSAFLAAWVTSDFNITAQFTVIFWEAGAICLLYILHRHLSLAHVFSPLRVGRIVQKYVKTAVISKNLRQVGYLNKPETIHIASFAVEVDGVAEELILKSLDHAPLFEIGDRIAFSRAFAAPLLLDRERDLHLCPWCGTIFPREDSDTCYHCHLNLKQER